MPEQDPKALYLELCRKEQELVNGMIEGAVLPDAGSPVHMRLDAIGEEIEAIKARVGPDTVRLWLEELHG